MTGLSEAAADCLEPDARGMVGDADDLLVAVASIAISLRRIADNIGAVTDYRFDAPAILTRKD